MPIMEENCNTTLKKNYLNDIKFKLFVNFSEPDNFRLYKICES